MIYIIAIVGIIIWAISAIQDSAKEQKAKQEKLNRVKQKWGNRKIDESLSLLERNKDVINSHLEKIKTGYQRWYYIENSVRDCVQDIAEAENRLDIAPNYRYLSNWKTSAPDEWKALATKLESLFKKRKSLLEDIENEVAKTRIKLNELLSKKTEPGKIQQINTSRKTGTLFLRDIRSILTPNQTPWKNKETNIANNNTQNLKIELLSTPINTYSTKQINKDIKKYLDSLEKNKDGHTKDELYFKTIRLGYSKKVKKSVIKRINYIINDIDLPLSLPKMWKVDYDPEQAIAIVEIQLPDVVHSQIYKKVKLKKGIVNKPITKKEIREQAPNFHPAILIRMAYEIFKNDILDTIDLLAINGWVEYHDPTTGKLTHTYTASLVVKKEQIIDINLNRINPLVAFNNLKGKSAGNIVDIIPITPTLSLDRKDKRLIDTKDVLNELGSETNLAAMDWQDFESLIAELFDKEFAKEGAEVKVTQASRDRGVDAIAFDPDPIRGGKFVIQAKRYTNTVDVSAVRDLCAVVKKEGASRGILVTTSTYGSDAYAFANNEPVTLMNGAELLGLLEKHGYKFKINLKEARKINTQLKNKK